MWKKLPRLMAPEDEAASAPGSQTSETSSETPETNSTEAPPSEQPEETGVAFEDPDFSKLTDSFESDDEVAEPPPVEPVSEEQPPEVEETPPAVAAEPEKKEGEGESKEEPPKPEATPEKTETPAKAAEPTPDTPPEFKMPTKEELDGMYKEHREQMLPKFEEIFTLSEEEAAALDEQPSKVLPKLAARLMYDTMLGTFNATVAATPSIVNRLIEASTQAKKAETAFYDAWPDLKGKEHERAVGTAIRSYRSANPRATLEEVVQNAGVMAMINLGKDPRVKANGQQPPAAAPPPAPPPKPAGARSTTQVAPPTPRGDEEVNIFGEIADAFKSEFS